ncbi:MAG: hypothetical protein KA793_03070 [Bacteroidales bacterium]|nr:hypothetical protein [Bacteroidales bacterium]
MNELIILGINVKDRIKEAGKTQKVLSAHRQIIKTRMGFHEVNELKCSRNGLIILEIQGDQTELQSLFNDLNEIGGIEVKQMRFKA